MGWGRVGWGFQILHLFLAPSTYNMTAPKIDVKFGGGWPPKIPRTLPRLYIHIYIYIYIYILCVCVWQDRPALPLPQK